MPSPHPIAAIVTPCFNEEARLDVQAFTTFMEAHEDIVFCFVNDGSKDGTAAVLEQLQQQCPSRLRILDLDRNHGKAEAVRQGVLYILEHHAVDYVGYWDADLATPLTEIPLFLDMARANPELAWIAGSRICRLGTDIRRRAMRHYLGRVFATAVSNLLNLKVYDTQCGAKLLRASTARAIFEEPFISNWIFDVELIARLIRHHAQDDVENLMYEIPLRAWSDVAGSKILTSAFLIAPFELCRIAIKYKPWRRHIEQER